MTKLQTVLRLNIICLSTYQRVKFIDKYGELPQINTNDKPVIINDSIQRWLNLSILLRWWKYIATTLNKIIVIQVSLVLFYNLSLMLSYNLSHSSWDDVTVWQLFDIKNNNNLFWWHQLWFIYLILKKSESNHDEFIKQQQQKKLISLFLSK